MCLLVTASNANSGIGAGRGCGVYRWQSGGHSLRTHWQGTGLQDGRRANGTLSSSAMDRARRKTEQTRRGLKRSSSRAAAEGAWAVLQQEAPGAKPCGHSACSETSRDPDGKGPPAVPENPSHADRASGHRQDEFTSIAENPSGTYISSGVTMKSHKVMRDLGRNENENSTFTPGVPPKQREEFVISTGFVRETGSYARKSGS